MADANHSIGGAAAAVPTDAPGEEEQLALLDAVLTAIRRYAAQHLAQGLPMLPIEGTQPALPRQAEPPSPLTPKQRQILRYIALGFATKQIAYQLHLSPKTVAAHRVHIMERLDIHDLVGLVIYALRQGLVGLDDYSDPEQPDRLVRSRP